MKRINSHRNGVACFLLLAACSFGAASCSSSGESGQDGGIDGGQTQYSWTYPVVRTEGRNLVDEYGRTVMLRGINVGGRSKMPPFIPWQGSPQDETFDADVKKFMDFPADWQMNVFRLTVFWEAVEPQRGKIDESYLALVDRQVKEAAERGIYVFLDFHQDLFSRYLGGSGAPPWALEDPPAEPPVLDDNGWFLKVFSDPKVLAAFDRFWSNEDGIQDAYIAAVTATAARYKDQANVLGIDLMNEPNPGAAGKQDLAAWYTDLLIPFYKKLAAEIRKTVPRYMVFIEPSGTEAGASESRPGWTITGLDNYMLSPHYYYANQFITGTYDGDIGALRTALKERNDRGKDLGVPVLLSEYGFRGIQDDTGKDDNAGKFIRDLYRVLDENLMHGTIWTHEVSRDGYWNREDCSFVNGDWTERVPRADAVARPYAEFTSGTPVSFEFDPTKKSITYRYTSKADGNHPTVIRLPKRHYPAPPKVTLTFGSWAYTADKGVLLVRDGKENAGKEQVVEVSR